MENNVSDAPSNIQIGITYPQGVRATRWLSRNTV
jgi:hypothetical protein